MKIKVGDVVSINPKAVIKTKGGNYTASSFPQEKYKVAIITKKLRYYVLINDEGNMPLVEEGDRHWPIMFKKEELLYAGNGILL
jgi:hypothetical protein